jgi:acetyl-CoA acetyltransferase
MSIFRDQTAIAGIAHSGCHKKASVETPVLWVRTAKAAAEDAGLSLSDIDGITSIHTSPVADATLPSPYYMTEALGIKELRWHGGALGAAPGVGVLGSAAAAVAAGLCDVALAVHTMERPKPNRKGPSNNLGAAGVSGNMAFLAPYGYAVFIQWMAAWQARYQHETGLTREQLGRMVVDQRTNALDNENAVMKTPLTLDDYLGCRMVAEPICLYDADMPVDAATAWIVTSAERAKDLKQKPVYLSSIGTWLAPRPDFVFFDDYADMMIPASSRDRFWRDADMQPQDMDFTELHDGFSIYTLYWLEALGLVKKADVPDFVGSGELSAKGSLPNNTHGGNLSEGRLQGGGHVIEAVHQLRGHAGKRQVEGAERCVISTGGPPCIAAAVLHA